MIVLSGFAEPIFKTGAIGNLDIQLRDITLEICTFEEEGGI
jgi:hypothetical protein